MSARARSTSLISVAKRCLVFRALVTRRTTSCCLACPRLPQQRRTIMIFPAKLINPIIKAGLLFTTLLLVGEQSLGQNKTDGFGCPDRNLSARPNAKIDLGDVTKKAIYLPHPKYPASARTLTMSERVNAEVVIDINSGRVVWASVTSDHPLLSSAVSDVVCRARFAPTYDVDGFVSGSITYRFARRRYALPQKTTPALPPDLRRGSAAP